MIEPTEKGPPIPGHAFAFDFEKMSPPALLALGRAMCLSDLIERLAPHALKTLDIKERVVLDKIIRTVELERRSAMEAAIELAKKIGAVKKHDLAPSTETAQ